MEEDLEYCIEKKDLGILLSNQCMWRLFRIPWHHCFMFFPVIDCPWLISHLEKKVETQLFKKPASLWIFVTLALKNKYSSQLHQLLYVWKILYCALILKSWFYLIQSSIHCYFYHVKDMTPWKGKKKTKIPSLHRAYKPVKRNRQ